MKLDILRKIIREEVKGAIQEELKDLLLEAIRTPKPVVETQTYNPTSTAGYLSPSTSTSTSTVSKEQLRENYRNILGETAASFNTSQVGKPLQMNGSIDTASPNGRLPDGEVSMNMIMGLMNKK
jgi:putative lipoic acid-binding regulatory protein